MDKMTLSVGLFEESEGTQPKRVANISFVKQPGSFVRIALKDSGLIVFDQKFMIDRSKAEEIIKGGEELCYAPDKLMCWVLDFLKKELQDRSPLLADLMDMLIFGGKQKRRPNDGKIIELGKGEVTHV